MAKKVIDWRAREIVLRLEPSGEPRGREPLEASVFPDYADDARCRFVQELCGLVGGPTACIAAGDGMPAVPVSNWQTPNVRQRLGKVAEVVENAARTGTDVFVYGASRGRWLLDVVCRDGGAERLDDSPDTDSRTATVLDKEPNGVRTRF